MLVVYLNLAASEICAVANIAVVARAGMEEPKKVSARLGQWRIHHHAGNVQDLTAERSENCRLRCWKICWVQRCVEKHRTGEKILS